MSKSVSVSDDPHRAGERILSNLAERNPDHILAAVSGGDDSVVALYFAYLSDEIDLDGILHVDTGIGIPQTRDYVESLADKLNLECYTLDDDNARYGHETFRYLVLKFGFPGANPIAHSQTQSNLKDKPFNRLVSSFDGDVALISGVRKSESSRRYQALNDLAEEGINEIKQITWVSPIAEFDESDLDQFRDTHDIPENMVTALLNSSGECLCAFEDRRRLKTLNEFFPEVAYRINKLEIEVLELVCRGEINPDYAIWCHGSLSSGEYEARTDSEQKGLFCADCEDACGNTNYDMGNNDPLTPAEAYIQQNDLDDYWNWPFYCAPCDQIITKPVTHRKECHPWGVDIGLEGQWDLRLIELGKSQRHGVLITEPNGYNLHVNELTPSIEEATNRKHRHYHDNFALSVCDPGDHTWHDYNGGPVKQCEHCYAFNLSEYNPESPGPPVVKPNVVDKDTLTQSERQKQKAHRTLNTFTNQEIPMPNEGFSPF